MSHFNEKATQWDHPQKIEMMQTLAHKTQEVLQQKNLLTKPIDIVDFGCGTGLFGLAFESFANTLVGIDTSEGMLEVFKDKIQNKHNMRAMLVDMEQEDVLLQTDLFISSMAFHHLKDPSAMLGKFIPLLKKNGAIAIVDLDKEDGSFHPKNEELNVHHLGFSKQEVEHWATANNLSLHYEIIHTLHKNDHAYPIFLAVLKNG